MREKRSRKLSQRLQQTVARVERLGGKMFIGPGVPDAVLEAFLDEVDDCPLCREAAELAERARVPPTRRSH